MRKNPLARKVRRAYSQDTLRRILTLREDRFGRAFGMQTVTVDTRYPSWRDSEQSENYYHFKDNGSRVLAVAHLDTVVRQAGRTPHFTATKNGPLITSGALDDRLGAYVILDLLPKVGVNCDWLFTVGEESGQSTAEHFKAEKDYDWAIEFDRMGTDVVMYQYEDRASRAAVEASGARVGSGSYSDIACLDQLGVKAFNWGVGYRGDYHSVAGYAYLNDTFGMVAKYMRFHEQNAGLSLPHDADDYDSGYGRRSGSSKWWEDNYYEDCHQCGAGASVDSATGYCEMCHACWDCGMGEDECMCYVPASRSKSDDHDAHAGTLQVSTDDGWKQMTFAEYTAQRPGAPRDSTCPNCDRDPDACTCELDEADINHAACIMAGPDTLDSHKHAGQDGLWIAARRYNYDYDSLNRHEAAEGAWTASTWSHTNRPMTGRRCASGARRAGRP